MKKTFNEFAVEWNGCTLKFDTLLQPTEWRYSASVLGLKMYFDGISGYEERKYLLLSELKDRGITLPEEINPIFGFDGILYNSKDITEEHYFAFVEKEFASEMTHLKILDNIRKYKDIDDEKAKQQALKDINELIKSKSVLKSLLKEKFDGTNEKYFTDIIENNRTKIIKEIYRYSPLMYRGFSNINLLFAGAGNHARLHNYTVDENRKTRYLGYGFDKDTFVGEDIPEFDFIPFAFTKTYESYFVNNNFGIKDLEQTNRKFWENIYKIEDKSSSTKLYKALKNADDYINYDVEIIIKPRDKEQYQTLYVRAERLKAMREIKSDNLKFYYKVNDDFYFNLENEVYESCLNDILLNDVIEFMLKLSVKQQADDINTGMTRTQIDKIIHINEKWKGVSDMTDIDRARATGFYVSQQFVKDKNENKLNSYKQKLISSIVAHDYSRMNEILLSLSSYINQELGFAYPLFEKPEENIGLAYAFANALSQKPVDPNKDNKKENE
ncbi:MAG: type I CRISPR-associated protein Cas8a1/Csx8 [Clostridia bacterium]|nr:type I CRISPR-associated protein Cas8a1/Csx8 [Clostridia bacterium]